MNDFTKLVMMETILSGNDARKDKIIKASQVFSGFELTKLDANTKDKFNKKLIKLNSILRQYDIKTFDDYDQITRVHLDKMIDTLKKICSLLKNNFK